uniref:Triacylglycerol lipase n=1 Tax=Varanus komodoensis TaxID=61221 RepID=A0A8D2KUB3_VARKO
FKFTVTACLFILSTAQRTSVMGLGCFTNDPPWGGTLQRPALNLPEPPEVVNTTFLLHTRENPTYFQVISAIYPSTIRISNFRTNRITRFIIHGHFAADDYLKIVEICKQGACPVLP